jgi:hypothetical protein
MTSEPHAASTPLPIGGHEAAARWAETATIDAHATVESGSVAAESGRALLRAARAGRPALDARNEPGQASPVRRFRLSATLNAGT